MNEQEFQEHFSSSEEADIIYNSAFYSEVTRKEYALLIKQRILQGGGRVLSLGSGFGNIELMIAPLVREVIGIDISAEAVLKAQQKAGFMGVKNAHFQSGSIMNIEFPPDSFDCVLALSSLHHLNDAAIIDLLQKSMLWLKPGGAFFSIDSSDRRLVGLFRYFFTEKYKRLHSPDERELNIGEVKRFFLSAGFKKISVYYSDYFLKPLAFLFPKLTKPAVYFASMVDSFLLAIPGMQHFASGFCVVARKGAKA